MFSRYIDRPRRLGPTRACRAQRIKTNARECSTFDDDDDARRSTTTAATRSVTMDDLDLDRAVETVRACARTGECGTSSACWRDEGAFKRALRAAARARLTAFGRRAGGRSGGEDGDDDGDDDDARRAGKRAKRTSASGGDSAETARASDGERLEDEEADAEARARRAYEEDVERVCGECISSFEVDAPFTIQRICELVCEPEKYYASPAKLMNAILKLFAVTQTVDRRGAGGAETRESDEVPTKAMVRDARDPVASEQKAFVASVFAETAAETATGKDEVIVGRRPPTIDGYDGDADAMSQHHANEHPPRPPSPQTVYT